MTVFRDKKDSNLLKEQPFNDNTYYSRFLSSILK